jgi:dynein light chain roadblock-type
MDMEEEGPDMALRKLNGNFGVLGYVILNKTGIPIQYFGMDQATATQYAALISEMVESTRGFLDTAERERDPLIEPELCVLRLRTRKHEIIVTPDGEFTLIAVQDPNYVEPPPKENTEGDEDEDGNSRRSSTA